VSDPTRQEHGNDEIAQAHGMENHVTTGMIMGGHITQFSTKWYELAGIMMQTETTSRVAITLSHGITRLNLVTTIEKLGLV
jgi:hypothetical protein